MLRFTQYDTSTTESYHIPVYFVEYIEYTF